jgi:hypothetical protein
MNDSLAHCRGWLRKAESDLADATDLVTLSGYAVEMRYDFDFWPDHQTAQEAFDLARAVREIVVSSIPAGGRP